MSMITLTEWARRYGLDPSGPRRKAQRGGFKTAVKVGRDWLIDANEPKTNLPRGRPFAAEKDPRRRFDK